MKIWQQKSIDKKIFETFIGLGKSPLTSAIIATRDVKIDTPKKLKAFINPNIRNLEDSANIHGMADMAQKVKDGNFKSVLIFGDYDVDGIFSTFMLEEVLKVCGVESVIPIIPDRAKDGYGLNSKSVKKICQLAPNDVDAIFLLDCGTNSRDEITKIKSKLNDPQFLIIDHHIIDKDKFSDNAFAIVNHRLGKKSSAYCTAALIYFLAKELEKLGVEIKHDLLPYAAIGTIADVSDLDMNNRILVYNGLKKLGQIENIGIQELIKVCGIDTSDCDVEDVSFKLAPRINANGRIDKAEFALELMHSTEEDDAFEKAVHINDLNDKRRKHQKKIFSEAIKQVGADFDGEAILVYNKNWKAGVAGIVASKLVEKFGVPALVFGGEGDDIKGSGRSLGEINIKEVMDSVSHLFSRYGGHEMAAGASLKEEFLKTAFAEFKEAVSKYKEEKGIEGVVVEYDVKLKQKTFKRIDNAFCRKVHKFAPFGAGNRNIMFRVDDVTCESVKEWGSGSGGFVKLEGLNVDCFVYGENSGELSGKKMDILFQIEKNFKDDEDWAVVIREYKFK